MEKYQSCRRHLERVKNSINAYKKLLMLNRYYYKPVNNKIFKELTS